MFVEERRSELLLNVRAFPMQPDPIKEFGTAAAARRWRSLQVRIDIEDLDCLLGTTSA